MWILRLLKRIEDMNESGKKGLSSPGQGAQASHFGMIGHTIAVHNGKMHIPVYVSDNMIGHKARRSLRLLAGLADTPERTLLKG